MAAAGNSLSSTRRLRVLAAVAAGACALVPLAGCGSDDGGSSGSATKVEIVDFKYAPETIEVSAGDRVEWVNDDTTEHTATLDDNSQDTDSIAPGDGASLSFEQPGRYAYYCLFHPFMKGEVEVSG